MDELYSRDLETVDDVSRNLRLFALLCPDNRMMISVQFTPEMARAVARAIDGPPPAPPVTPPPTTGYPPMVPKMPAPVPLFFWGILVGWILYAPCLLAGQTLGQFVRNLILGMWP